MPPIPQDHEQFTRHDLAPAARDLDTMSLADMWKLFLQLVDSVVAGHRAGLSFIHVNPHNLYYVLYDRTFRLLDAGIDFDTSRFGASQTEDPFHQVSAEVLAFLAPEFVAAMKNGTPRDEAGIDAERAEVYALGMTAYWLLAKDFPFPIRKPEDVAGHILNTRTSRPLPVKPFSRRARAILAKCLEKNPSQRYATLDDLARAIKTVPPEVISNEEPRPLWIKVAAGASAVVVIALLVLAGLWFFSAPQSFRRSHDCEILKAEVFKQKPKELRTQHLDPWEHALQEDWLYQGLDARVWLDGYNIADNRKIESELNEAFQVAATAGETEAGFDLLFWKYTYKLMYGSSTTGSAGSSSGENELVAPTEIRKKLCDELTEDLKILGLGDVTPAFVDQPSSQTDHPDGARSPATVQIPEPFRQSTSGVLLAVLYNHLSGRIIPDALLKPLEEATVRSGLFPSGKVIDRWPVQHLLGLVAAEAGQNAMAARRFYRAARRRPEIWGDAYGENWCWDGPQHPVGWSAFVTAVKKLSNEELKTLSTEIEALVANTEPLPIFKRLGPSYHELVLWQAGRYRDAKKYENAFDLAMRLREGRFGTNPDFKTKAEALLLKIANEYLSFAEQQNDRDLKRNACERARGLVEEKGGFLNDEEIVQFRHRILDVGYPLVHPDLVVKDDLSKDLAQFEKDWIAVYDEPPRLSCPKDDPKFSDGYFVKCAVRPERVGQLNGLLSRKARKASQQSDENASKIDLDWAWTSYALHGRRAHQTEDAFLAGEKYHDGLFLDLAEELNARAEHDADLKTRIMYLERLVAFLNEPGLSFQNKFSIPLDCVKYRLAKAYKENGNAKKSEELATLLTNSNALKPFEQIEMFELLIEFEKGDGSGGKDDASLVASHVKIINYLDEIVRRLENEEEKHECTNRIDGYLRRILSIRAGSSIAAKQFDKDFENRYVKFLDTFIQRALNQKDGAIGQDELLKAISDRVRFLDPKDADRQRRHHLLAFAVLSGVSADDMKKVYEGKYDIDVLAKVVSVESVEELRNKKLFDNNTNTVLSDLAGWVAEQKWSDEKFKVAEKLDRENQRYPFRYMVSQIQKYLSETNTTKCVHPLKLQSEIWRPRHKDDKTGIFKNIENSYDALKKVDVVGLKEEQDRQDYWFVRGFAALSIYLYFEFYSKDWKVESNRADEQKKTIEDAYGCLRRLNTTENGILIKTPMMLLDFDETMEEKQAASLSYWLYLFRAATYLNEVNRRNETKEEARRAWDKANMLFERFGLDPGKNAKHGEILGELKSVRKKK